MSTYNDYPPEYDTETPEYIECPKCSTRIDPEPNFITYREIYGLDMDRNEYLVDVKYVHHYVCPMCGTFTIEW